ncbi:integrase [Sphingobium sp. OAS761]|uniref:tyrosine-type recombinase/integrase n=1 Tax=Sphingobium sp. OAS761 TaxID=2817901 RepID=UPI00209D4D8C|nr:site-specific integrase [Sphingobium sp. OAS761]MCP1469685.1 integrase [Sphingobium sp. OAS761]
MAQGKISKRAVDEATANPKRDTFIWDSVLKGFGLRVTKSGVKSYVIQYRVDGGPTRRTTIGMHGSPWTPGEARAFAEEFLYRVKQGCDPVQEKVEAKKAAEELAFDAYVDRFDELYLKTHWKGTRQRTESILRQVKPHFKNRPLTAIRRKDVSELLDGYVDRPAQRKLIHSVLRKLFNWAVDEGDLEVSPIAGMKAPKAVPSRKRVLSPEELVCLWLASGELSDIFRPIVRLLILTLQRRDEVASLNWSELDLENAIWELPAERAKNGEEHRVPLSQLAVAELDRLKGKRSGIVFTTTGITAASGFSKSKRALDKRMLEIMRERAEKRGEDPDEVIFTPWRYHDLRRTGATNLQALGVPVEVTEAVLNHISGTRGGIAGVYNRFRYEAEKQKALETWCAQLQHMIAARTSIENVVPFVRYAA